MAKYAASKSNGEVNNMSETIAVGKCLDHGVVFDDDLDYNFPAPSGCTVCGEQVEETMMESRSLVEQYTGQQ